MAVSVAIRRILAFRRKVAVAGMRKHRHSPTAWGTRHIDPKATFRFDDMNGRKARESGLRMKAAVCASAATKPNHLTRSNPSSLQSSLPTP